jgi:hypothetical protein
LNANRNSLKILETLEFNEIWQVSSLLPLVARKNKCPAKENKKIEFQLRKNWIDFMIV